MNQQMNRRSFISAIIGIPIAASVIFGKNSSSNKQLNHVDLSKLEIRYDEDNADNYILIIPNQQGADWVVDPKKLRAIHELKPSDFTRVEVTEKIKEKYQHLIFNNESPVKVQWLPKLIVGE